MVDGFINLPASLKGKVRIYELDRPTETLFQRDNVIVQGVSYLFARLLANSTDPVAGIWGLALGSGAVNTAGWSASSQPDPTATQTAMVAEIKRKALSQVRYIGSDGNPTTTLTTKVSFQTVINATTDAITIPIREMGLIGGGTTLTANGGPTNMLTGNYFDPAAPVANAVYLINYITIPPLVLPASINIGIDWLLSL